MKIKTLFILCLVAFWSCNTEPEKEKQQPTVPVPTPPEPAKPIVLNEAPSFNSENAYNFIQKQVDFGPRVPNTKTHKKCANYLAKTLAEFKLDTIVQRASVTAFTGKQLEIRNIIGQYKPELSDRILLCSHWDSRPFADRDSKKKAMPIEAANDGASGVGILLEIARILNETDLSPSVGVDIIFFDAEDYGQPNGTLIASQSNTWCLGSQYWSKNKHKIGYTAKYGILLDMVGAKDAVFPKDGISMSYAPQYVNKMWEIADKTGYGNYFINRKMPGQITDDHVYINLVAGIPCIDVIHYNIDKSDFGSFHHTHKDNMSIIDKKTLKAVGETVLQMIYQE